MISRRPVERMNRGRIATAGGVASTAWSPSQLSAGLEYWLAEDLSSAGDGVAVTGNWLGRQTGAIMAPFGADMGVYRANAFLGDGALTTAGLEQTTKAAKCTDAALVAALTGTNRTYYMWWLGELNASGTSYYWAIGDTVAVIEFVQFRYSPAGTIRNVMATRDGVALNSLDNMSEFQALAPQLLEAKRVSTAWTFYKDGVQEGTATRSDAGVSVGQIMLGGTAAGAAAATSNQTISAFGVASSMTAGDQTNLRAWAAARLGMHWKKGLIP